MMNSKAHFVNKTVKTKVQSILLNKIRLFYCSNFFIIFEGKRYVEVSNNYIDNNYYYDSLVVINFYHCFRKIKTGLKEVYHRDIQIETINQL